MYEIVNINFKMNINNNDISHVVEFSDQGKKYEKNNKTYYMFKEPLIEENKYNDLLIICNREEIVINRSGFVTMRQLFKKNELTIGFYKNQYINSELKTFTNQYEWNDNTIYLDYNIVINNEIIGHYKMEIKIKGVGSNE